MQYGELLIILALCAASELQILSAVSFWFVSRDSDGAALLVYIIYVAATHSTLRASVSEAREPSQRRGLPRSRKLRGDVLVA